MTRAIEQVTTRLDARQHFSGDDAPSNGVQPRRQNKENEGPLAQETDGRGGHVQTEVSTPVHRTSSPIPLSPHPISASREENEAILTSIQALQQQFMQQTGHITAMLAQRDGKEPSSEAHTSRQIENHEGQEEYALSDESRDVMTVLEKLKDLISKEGSLLFSDNAKSIIRSLDNILEIVEGSTAASEIANQPGKRKRRESSEVADVLQRPDIKRARGLLANSQCVTIGRRGKRSFFKPDSNDWRLIDCQCRHLSQD